MVIENSDHLPNILEDQYPFSLAALLASLAPYERHHRSKPWLSIVSHYWFLVFHLPREEQRPGCNGEGLCVTSCRVRVNKKSEILKSCRLEKRDKRKPEKCHNVVRASTLPRICENRSKFPALKVEISSEWAMVRWRQLVNTYPVLHAICVKVQRFSKIPRPSPSGICRKTARPQCNACPRAKSDIG